MFIRESELQALGLAWLERYEALLITILLQRAAMFHPGPFDEFMDSLREAEGGINRRSFISRLKRPSMTTSPTTLDEERLFEEPRCRGLFMDDEEITRRISTITAILVRSFRLISP